MAKNYESDVTKLIQQLKDQQPDTEMRQREGRARLWDKHIDLELQEGFKQVSVPMPPYVYYPKD